MIVLLHVIIALLSIGFTTYAYFRPSDLKLKLAYGLVGAMFISGIYLVWTAPAHMLEACMSGLVYLGIISVGIVAAKAKLAGLAKNHS